MKPVVKDAKVLDREGLTHPIYHIRIMIAPVAELAFPTTSVDDGQRAIILMRISRLIVALLKP
jgi:hypothetical protein